MQAAMAFENLMVFAELMPFLGLAIFVAGIGMAFLEKNAMFFVQSLFLSIMCMAMPNLLGVMSDMLPGPDSRPRTEMVKPDFVSETAVTPENGFSTTDVETTPETTGKSSVASAAAGPSVASNKGKTAASAAASAAVSASPTVKSVSNTKPMAAKPVPVEKADTHVNAEHKVVVVAPKQSPRPKVVDLNDEISGN